MKNYSDLMIAFIVVILLVGTTALGLSVGCTGPTLPLPKPDTPLKTDPVTSDPVTSDPVTSDPVTSDPVKPKVAKPKAVKPDEVSIPGELISAFRSGERESVILSLINAGLEVNEKDKTEDHGVVLDLTPLHYAASSYSLDVIELLISKGADINAKDAYGEIPRTGLELNEKLTLKEKTTAFMALGGTQKEAIAFTLRLTPPVNPTESFIAYLKSGVSDEEVLEVLRLDVDVNEVDKQGFSVLHTVAISRSFDVISALIGKGATAGGKESDLANSILYNIHLSEDEKQAIIAELNLQVDAGELVQTVEDEVYVPQVIDDSIKPSADGVIRPTYGRKKDKGEDRLDP